NKTKSYEAINSFKSQSAFIALSFYIQLTLKIMHQLCSAPAKGITLVTVYFIMYRIKMQDN
ncbi:MAG: hypothetical protein IKM86_09125, partial [Acidaminococcaceae bacterium]|nr:hypothetical protein [Acidaminococcaceae bacterium]